MMLELQTPFQYVAENIKNPNYEHDVTEYTGRSSRGQ